MPISEATGQCGAPTPSWSPRGPHTFPLLQENRWLLFPKPTRLLSLVFKLILPSRNVLL